MTIDRDTVLAQLRAEDVAHHLGIVGQWRGRWMRSSRCGATDHSSDAFGLARDGHWHCWACDQGGDLLGLIAIGEHLDIRSDFPAVLAVAATIAGVDDSDSWGGPAKPAPVPRPAPPPVMPVADRIALAKRRAGFAWDRLFRYEDVARARPDGSFRSLGEVYLKARGVDVACVQRREEFRETPLRATMEEIARHAELKSLAYLFAPPGVVVAVRALADGAKIDLRVRRLEPRGDQPKIIGMLGGITCAPATPSRPRELLGCYGHPHAVDADLVVIVEGLIDYLTALCQWPDACVLGAVEAGSLALVTAHAARQLAGRDQLSRILIVEQNDPPRTLKDGRVVAGAADASINEDPNAATKVAMRILGPKRVGWLFCDGPGIKDLNDLVRAHADIGAMVRWETEIGS